MRSVKMIVCLTLLFAAAPSFAAPGDEAPAWLKQMAASQVPAYDKDVPAVVLRREQIVTVSSDGKITTSNFYAVRILTREGRVFAMAAETYLTKTSKVRELNAWLIRPNGSVKKYGKDQTIDRIRDPNDIYDEQRLKIIDASDDADAGVVFGYEAAGEDRPLFTQDLWAFQNRLPTLTSRYTLNLPSGWRASSVIFNYPKLEPAVSGSTYTWELRNLAPIKPEPASPPVDNLAPIAAINYFPADSGPLGVRTFENWVQVSRFGLEMHDPQAVPDEKIAAKARELTANATTELDKIKAIARFIQGLQYISIDIGVGKGNGLRPHAASQVLAKAYGDCKDKANLMRTMLKTINITAYPVFIYLGDPTRVREEWASPSQFNHCIIAIKVGDETRAETVIQHAVLGRLLIFDATDEHTAVGDLPEEEQGSLALIVAGDSGGLTRMPVLPPESSQLSRHADVILTSDGSITVNLKVKSTGQTAVNERRGFRALTPAEYRGAIERWVTRGATAAKISRLTPVDDTSTGRFNLDVDFTATAYAQSMQDRLLVFKPAIVSRHERLFFTEAKRNHAVVLEPYSFNETVSVKLPTGFAVDELPDAVELDAPFGTYKTNYEVKGDELLFTRILSQRSATIPVDQYQVVRSFFEKIRAAEQAPVVLARK